MRVRFFVPTKLVGRTLTESEEQFLGVFLQTLGYENWRVEYCEDNAYSGPGYVFERQVHLLDLNGFFAARKLQIDLEMSRLYRPEDVDDPNCPILREVVD